jgi:hypothetical protein
VIWVARIGSIGISTKHAVLHEAMPRYHFPNLRFCPFIVIWVARIGSIRISTNYALLHEAMQRYHFSNLRVLPFLS